MNTTGKHKGNLQALAMDSYFLGKTPETETRTNIGK